MNLTTKYFKISDIAAFFGINTSAIRYYESYGILTPAYIDKKTKYRYYDTSNVNTLAYICNLRQSGMEMAQIKKYLQDKYTREKFIEELTLQRDTINKILQLNISQYIDKNETKIEIIDIPEFTCFKKKYIAKNIEEIYKCFYDFLHEAVTSVKCVKDAIAFIEYDSLVPQFENVRFTAGLRAEEPKENCSTHERILGVRSFYKGPYEKVGESYEKIIAYIEERGFQPKGTAIEFYHESFNIHKNPEDFLTEIIIPIKDI